MPLRINIDIDDLMERYANGTSVNQLAEYYGVSRDAINRRLVKQGIQPRSQVAANRLLAASRTLEQRRAYSAAANAARRSRPASATELANKALSRKQQVAPGETLIAGWLESKGLITDPQSPVGPYNIDIAVGAVAVELHTTARNPSSDPVVLKRVDYLINAGWSPIYVWVSYSHILTEACTDQIIAWLELTKRNPTMRRQYRVIRGTGEIVYTGRPQRD